MSEAFRKYWIQAVERRSGQILEWHDRAEDSSRQVRLTWKRHAEAFAQRWDTTTAQ